MEVARRMEARTVPRPRAMKNGRVFLAWCRGSRDGGVSLLLDTGELGSGWEEVVVAPKISRRRPRLAVSVFGEVVEEMGQHVDGGYKRAPKLGHGNEIWAERARFQLLFALLKKQFPRPEGRTVSLE